MNNTKQSSAIYFKSLELNNIRCFGKSQILNLSENDDIPSQWTLILGNNGVGKTTLLQCLAWMRPVPWVGEDNKISGVTPALQDEENAVFEKLLRDHQKGESLITARLTQGVYFTIVMYLKYSLTRLIENHHSMEHCRKLNALLKLF